MTHWGYDAEQGPVLRCSNTEAPQARILRADRRKIGRRGSAAFLR
jgi:hypothetical protein